METSVKTESQLESDAFQRRPAFHTNAVQRAVVLEQDYNRSVLLDWQDRR